VDILNQRQGTQFRKWHQTILKKSRKGWQNLNIATSKAEKKPLFVQGEACKGRANNKAKNAPFNLID